MVVEEKQGHVFYHQFLLQQLLYYGTHILWHCVVDLCNRLPHLKWWCLVCGACHMVIVMPDTLNSLEYYRINIFFRILPVLVVKSLFLWRLDIHVASGFLFSYLVIFFSFL